MKVIIAGVGNMGKTYAKSLLSTHFTRASDLYLLVKNEHSDPGIKEIPRENISNDPAKNIPEADIVVLAVKPQDFNTLASAISPFIKSDQLILSIMAGITMQTISNLLGAKKVVRAMPNLPAQVGMGITAFTCLPELDKKELFIIQNLLNTTGKSVYLDDEKLIDAATALSGSGPAYVYYFMQSMIQAGIQMGFNQSEAELMVNQTFLGAVSLHNRSDLTCQEWIKKVASKGGTTEAALKIFENNTLQQTIEQGIFSAFNRAKELGGN
jgi:pyrroline-5-carboxylate reductase